MEYNSGFKGLNYEALNLFR